MFRATLCFLTKRNRVLLIEKKRGPGQGMYNAPGGKIQSGETPRDAAIRETREETGLTVRGLEKCGEIRFYIGTDPFSHVHVFRATKFDGTPRETTEARPSWFDVDGLPFDDMWAGDRYWLPRILSGESLEGSVWFDETGDAVVDYALEEASF